MSFGTGSTEAIVRSSIVFHYSLRKRQNSNKDNTNIVALVAEVRTFHVDCVTIIFGPAFCCCVGDDGDCV